MVMLKHKASTTWKLLGIALMVSLSGCASAYYDYQGSCIPYRYCPPSPLPFVAYEGCHCPTPVGPQYLQRRDIRPRPAAPNVDVPIESPLPAGDQQQPASPIPE